MAHSSTLKMYASFKEGTGSLPQTLTLIFVPTSNPLDITFWHIQRIAGPTPYRLLVEAPKDLSSTESKTYIGEFPASQQNCNAVAEDHLPVIIERLQSKEFIVQGEAGGAQVASFFKDLQAAMLAVWDGETADLDFGGFEIAPTGTAGVQSGDAGADTA
ncbi:hypothetical protein BDW68DRAFT_182856 [Aspergillus falconensis]